MICKTQKGGMKYAIHTDPHNPSITECEIVWRGRMTRLLRQCFANSIFRIIRPCAPDALCESTMITIVIRCWVDRLHQWSPKVLRGRLPIQSVPKSVSPEPWVGGSEFGNPPGQRFVQNPKIWLVMFVFELQSYHLNCTNWSYQLNRTNWKVLIEKVSANERKSVKCQKRYEHVELCLLTNKCKEQF